MTIRVHNPIESVGENRGSCSDLVQYLDKENRDLKEEDKTHFFNKEGDEFSASVVERTIDNNKAKLKKTDTKFYMLTVNPSTKELQHIGGDEEKFKSYINDVMDVYASNFNRTFKDGRPLTGDDILYYAKIEHERTYKFNEKRYAEQMEFNKNVDKEIRSLEKELSESKGLSKEALQEEIYHLKNSYIRNSEGTIIKEGNLKDGNNLHAHIVVSRLDKSQKMQLSPTADSRGSKHTVNGNTTRIGFNRDAFVGKGEKLFDDKFGYDRAYEESYQYFKESKQIRSLNNLLHLSDPKSFAKAAAKRVIKDMIADKELQKHLGYAVNPKKIPRSIVQKLENKAIEGILKSLGAGAYTNPATAAMQTAKQIILSVAQTVSKGMGI